MKIKTVSFVLAALVQLGSLWTATAIADDNRLTYLDELSPYHPSLQFPVLTTDQWVGDPTVEAVVVFAIDDMRGPERWEAYLRPILERLKQIDGRAAVSIMTCRIEPEDPHLQKWLEEGLSLEVHTVDHPCPILKLGDLSAAKSTFDRCVDLMNAIPGNRPVAFRTPCCDSLNTVSPRFFSEIFNKVTDDNLFLQVDSSVFQLFTSDDPLLPRELVLNENGGERFAHYLPPDRGFYNTITNYPYPYVIGNKCWEFPCVTPSDWAAQHVQKPANPETLADWNRALDATVVKKGTFNLVFHPYDWIRSDQIVSFIDRNVKKYGKRILFLTFREALDRLNKNLLAGNPLRNDQGKDNGVRLMDVNADGFMDVTIGNKNRQETRLWNDSTRSWTAYSFPSDQLVDAEETPLVRFGILQNNRHSSAITAQGSSTSIWHFRADGWVKDEPMSTACNKLAETTRLQKAGRDSGLRLRDLTHDGIAELITQSDRGMAVYRWDHSALQWSPLQFQFPEGFGIVDSQGRDSGLRLVDINQDGRDDIILSNTERRTIRLFVDEQTGWSDTLFDLKSPSDQTPIPMIVRDGALNGAWFHSDSIVVQNEFTAENKDLVERTAFDQILSDKKDSSPLNPEAALRSIHLRSGMTGQLVAAEPLVQDPVAIDWGPDGKLWVAEMADYPLGINGKGTFGGRIRFLKDEDQDGIYDKSTVFIEGIGYPNGVKAWRDGVLVTCAPHIFFARDTTGDGKADEKTILFEGFVEGNQQHRVNGLTFGLDNWIYCANGDSGGSVRSLKTNSLNDIRGRDFRFQPETGEFDLQTGQTQFGRSRDDWGNWFGNNNSNPMYHFVLKDHYLRRNRHLANPPSIQHVSNHPGAAQVYPRSITQTRFNDLDKANRFTSACSAMIYRDELLGREFAGNSFVCEPVHNLVHREIVEPRGASFQSHRASDERESEFLASTDNWFRPTQVQTGPDGALWIVDMYREVIEHPEWIPKSMQAEVNLRGGSDRGRIYRVYPRSRPPRPVKELQSLTNNELVRSLDTPNGWTRDMVQQILIWRKATDIADELESVVSNGSRNVARLHALCTLDGLEKLSTDTLLTALRDPDAGVRRHAIRLCEPFLNRNNEIAQAVGSLAEPDPGAQLQLAYTLGEWNNSEAGRALGRLAVGADKHLTAAILSAPVERVPDILDGYVAAHSDQSTTEIFPRLIRMALAVGNQTMLTTAIGHLTPAEGEAAKDWQIHILGEWLQSLNRRSDSLLQIYNRSSPEFKQAVERLESTFETARTLASDTSQPLDRRINSIAVLGRGRSSVITDQRFLIEQLEPAVAIDIQRAAVAALGASTKPQMALAMLGGWKSYSPSLRNAVLDQVIARATWTKILIIKITKSEIPASEIPVLQRQKLLSARAKEIRAAAQRLFESQPATKSELSDRYAKASALSGDADKGKAVFEKSCASCHKIQSIGNDVGPDLSGLSNRSYESMVTAVFTPNEAVESKYLSYTIGTRDGRTLAGLLTNESGASLTLIGNDGKPQTLLRKEIEILESSGKSLMPEGLDKEVSPENFADLVAFLKLHRPSRKEFAGNSPMIVQPEALRGEYFLQARYAEIYGQKLVFEQRFANLGFWGDISDHAVWKLKVVKPGRYRVMMDWACPTDTAGNTFRLEVGTSRLTGVVESTGSWEVYRQKKIATIELTAGTHSLVVRSDGAPRGFLMDLRGIRITPE